MPSKLLCHTNLTTRQREKRCIMDSFSALRKTYLSSTMLPLAIRLVTVKGYPNTSSYGVCQWSQSTEIFISGSVGTLTHVQSTIKKPGMIPVCNITLKKPSFSRGLSGHRKLFSPVIRKGVLVPCVKAPETTTTTTQEDH